MARSARSKSYKRVEDKVDFGPQWTRREDRPQRFDGNRQGGGQRPYRAPRPQQGGPQRGEHRPYHRSEGYRSDRPAEERPDRPGFAGKKAPSKRSGKPRPPAADRKPRRW
jgi:hypothetical protein